MHLLGARTQRSRARRCARAPARHTYQRQVPEQSQELPHATLDRPAFAASHVVVQVLAPHVCVPDVHAPTALQSTRHGPWSGQSTDTLVQEFVAKHWTSHSAPALQSTLVLLQPSIASQSTTQRMSSGQVSVLLEHALTAAGPLEQSMLQTAP